jgi:hypothetical protein
MVLFGSRWVWRGGEGHRFITTFVVRSCVGVMCWRVCLFETPCVCVDFFVLFHKSDVVFQAFVSVYIMLRYHSANSTEGLYE